MHGRTLTRNAYLPPLRVHQNLGATFFSYLSGHLVLRTQYLKSNLLICVVIQRGRRVLAGAAFEVSYVFPYVIKTALYDIWYISSSLFDCEFRTLQLIFFS